MEIAELQKQIAQAEESKQAVAAQAAAEQAAAEQAAAIVKPPKEKEEDQCPDH